MSKEISDEMLQEMASTLKNHCENTVCVDCVFSNGFGSYKGCALIDLPDVWRVDNA